MTLTAIRLAKFKAFTAEQRLRLHPITLIYGGNRAGNAGALHALALAHHASATRDLYTQRARIGGEAIDLGKLRRCVHRCETERHVETGSEFDPGLHSGRLHTAPRTMPSLLFARGPVCYLPAGEAPGVRTEVCCYA